MSKHQFEYFNSLDTIFQTKQRSVYLQMLYSAGLISATYAFILLYFKAWFAFALIALKAFVIIPICILIAKRTYHAIGRALFVSSSILLVTLASIASNNQIEVHFFYISITISSLILFNFEEFRYIALTVFWIILGWFATLYEAYRILPENWIADDLPLFLLDSVGFIGSLALSITYVSLYVSFIRSYHKHAIKQSEDSRLEIKKAFELLTKISNNVPGVVYQYLQRPDGSACFPYASSGIQKIYRVNPEDVKTDASQVFKILHQDDYDNIIASIDDSSQNNTPWKCDFRVQFTDGTIEWRRGLAQPQREPDGSTLWHGFITDITKEKNLQLEIEEAQTKLVQTAKMATLGEMAGGIAHEINNPLMVISSKASLIQVMLSAATPNLQKAIDELERIKSTTLRIASIVKGLLIFSRGDKQEPHTTVSIDEIINNTLDLSYEKFNSHNIEFQKNIEAGLYINGNAIQISQVILNILNNSLDAIRNNDTKRIRLDVKRLKNGLIEFSITDSGKGLTTEQANKIMQPFYTTKDIGKGTGLGLSISRGLIESHGGQLLYDSQSTNTRFYFRLPQCQYDQR